MKDLIAGWFTTANLGRVELVLDYHQLLLIGLQGSKNIIEYLTQFKNYDDILTPTINNKKNSIWLRIRSLRGRTLLGSRRVSVDFI